MGKYSRKVIFGEGACRVYDETGNFDKVNDFINKYDGEMVDVSFETQAELEAYIRGLNEGNGWEDFWVIQEE